MKTLITILLAVIAPLFFGYGLGYSTTFPMLFLLSCITIICYSKWIVDLLSSDYDFDRLLRPKVFHISNKWGVSFCLTSIWIGKHYSYMNKRLCIQPIPFFCIYINLI